MEKLTKAFRKADSGDILTYSMVGVMALMMIGVASLPVIDHFVTQNSENATSSQSLTLGR